MAKSKKQTATVNLEARRRKLGISLDELAAGIVGLTDVADEEKTGFGKFLEGVVAHPERPQWPPEKLELSDEEDARSWRKVFAPRRQQAEIDGLKKKVRGLVAGRKAAKAGPDLADALIAKIKRDNPSASIEDICKKLDGMRGGVALPARFRKLGFISWHDIWSDKKYRNRVKREISSIHAARQSKRYGATTVTSVT